MDACSSLENEIERIVSKMNGLEKYSAATLQELIDSITAITQELRYGGGEGEVLHQAHVMVLESLIKKIRDTTTSLTTQHRDLHVTISKVGKNIEKNFCSDLSVISRPGIFEDEKNQVLINRVICEHFLRLGYKDIAKSFMNEANVEVSEQFEGQFSEMNAIIQSLRDHELEPALNWVARHRETLNAQRSHLEIKLQRLQFLRLLQDGASVITLCEYAKQNLQHLAENHERDIQELMGCLLYMKGDSLSRSPYAHFLSEEMWTDVSQVFAKDACSVLGFSVESPLAVCINAGCVAVSSLIGIKQVMQQRQVNVWCNNDELPIEIHLDRKHHFHSVFACPILRQQSSDLNPPMRLVCGHVISQEALQKLASASKLKCPYCPGEQSPCDARELHF